MDRFSRLVSKRGCGPAAWIGSTLYVQEGHPTARIQNILYGLVYLSACHSGRVDFHPRLVDVVHSSHADPPADPHSQTQLSVLSRPLCIDYPAGDADLKLD